MEPDTDGAQQSDTIVAGDPFSDPPLDDLGDAPPPPIGEPRGVVAPNRVIGGVAADLASRLGVDPLWIRLAFVALIAFGGLGFVAYVGLWLVLVGGARPGWGWTRYVGAAVIAIGLLVLFSDGNILLGNPFVTVMLLAGVAIALWQPRGVPAREPGESLPRASGFAPSATLLVPERSVLGRWILATAMLVGAGGALIDQFNDGRLHPEQWLGAAATICGLGVVISAFRGRAYWLTIPALVLGAAGFVAGHAARAGVNGDINLGDNTYHLGNGFDSLPTSDSALFGQMRVYVDGAPAEQNRTDLRMGIGVIYVNVAYGVTVEVRATLHDGDASIDGMLRPSPDGDEVVLRVGPEGKPDVVISAEVSHGNVRVTTGPSNDWRETMATVPFAVTTAPFVGIGSAADETAIDIGEGFRMLRDGTVLFPSTGSSDPPVVITPDGGLSTNLSTADRENGVTAIFATGADGGPAEYLLLPNGMILTPNGTVIDIPAERGRVLNGSTTTAQPSTSAMPAETTEF